MSVGSVCARLNGLHNNLRRAHINLIAFIMHKQTDSRVYNDWSSSHRHPTQKSIVLFQL